MNYSIFFRIARFTPPERSETDEETDSSEKRKIFIYDRSWRSEEV
jgi:hypothetical protein